MLIGHAIDANHGHVTHIEFKHCIIILIAQILQELFALFVVMLFMVDLCCQRDGRLRRIARCRRFLRIVSVACSLFVFLYPCGPNLLQ